MCGKCLLYRLLDDRFGYNRRSQKLNDIATSDKQQETL